MNGRSLLRLSMGYLSGLWCLLVYLILLALSWGSWMRFKGLSMEILWWCIFDDIFLYNHDEAFLWNITFKCSKYWDNKCYMLNLRSVIYSLLKLFFLDMFCPEMEFDLMCPRLNLSSVGPSQPPSQKFKASTNWPLLTTSSLKALASFWVP